MLKSIITISKQFARKVKSSIPQSNPNVPIQKLSPEDEEYQKEFLQLKEFPGLDSFLKNTKQTSELQTKDSPPPKVPEPEEEQEIKQANEVTEKEIKLIQETLLYQGDDPYSEKIVQRPKKGFVWGLGGELMKVKERIFTKGESPTPEEIMAFLEFEQCKDIVCINLEELGRIDLARHGIIASTFSCRHTYKVAASLKNALVAAEIPNLPIPPRVYGRKDDEWVMIAYQDMMVHLFVEEAREEVDLEWKWKNPVNEEEFGEIERMANSKRKKQIREPLKK